MNKSILLIACISFSVPIFSQGEPPEATLPTITPPSAIASESSMLGNTRVGMFTGSTNLTLPLVTYKTKTLEVPVTLSYNNGGITVDKTSGNAGLGWIMSCGGVISRIVRDKKDENGAGTSFAGPAVFGEGQTQERFDYYTQISQNVVDSEPDLYSFNFNGNSGQFIFDSNDNIFMLKACKIKITYNTLGFIATDTNGVQYHFTTKEYTHYTTSITNHIYSPPEIATSAWYLTKIIHPCGDEIYFEYTDTDYTYTSSTAQTISKMIEFEPGVCTSSQYQNGFRVSYIYENILDVVGKKLSRIYSNNSHFGQLNFSYDINDADIQGFPKISGMSLKDNGGTSIENLQFQYLTTANNRMFLKDITYLNPEKKYSFDYINPQNLPNRLSFSQDIWGYYNGKSNSMVLPEGLEGYELENYEFGGANRKPDFVYTPTGMLQKITYPTKGFTTFDYEPNDAYGSVTVNPAPTTRRVQAILPSGNEEEEISILSTINQKIDITGKSSFNSDCSENQNLGPSHHTGSLQVLDVESNIYMPIYSISQAQGGAVVSNGTSIYLTPSTGHYYINAQANKTYIFQVEINHTCTNAYADIKYLATEPVIVNENVPQGGVRVKRELDYVFDGAVPEIKRYYYAALDDLSRSSGNLYRANPDFGEFILFEDQCSEQPQPTGPLLGIPILERKTDWVISSGNFSSLVDEGGNSVYYPKVIESFGGDDFENGAVTHLFKVSRGTVGHSELGPPVIGCPRSNDNWDNGLELSKSTYSKKNSELIKVKEQINEFRLDSSISDMITVFQCKKHYMIWVNMNFGNNFGIAFPNLSIMSYRLFSNWSYLKTMRELQYDLDGNNPVEKTTNYYYANRDHIQLTSQTTTSSKSEVLETKYYYPQDAEVSSELYMPQLIARNMIGTPVRTETYRAGTKLSEQKTQYGSFESSGPQASILPEFIYEGKADQVLEKKVSFQYDDSGNIIQYTPEGGVPVSIIWGYNKSKPVAKIENATYQLIPSNLITDIKTATDTGTEASVLAALTALRDDSSLKDALVTSFTYKPLVGVSVVTDPKGKSAFYTYDQFGRLSSVKDSEGHIVSENEYHYKNQ